jgi:octaprenyl-diphosphate synthase
VKKEIIYIIKNENTNKSKVELVMKYVAHYGGLEYAKNIMNQYKNNALDILYTYPKSEARDVMEELVNFTISRNK